MTEREQAATKRERLRQEELKKNPGGAFNDGLTRSTVGNLVDLVGGVSWKVTGIFIIILIAIIIIIAVF